MVKTESVDQDVWEIPRSGKMNVPGRVWANKALMDALQEEAGEKPEWNALNQIQNVAMLPGIQKYSLALPDVHCGYGAAVGSVGAFGWEEGVIAFGLIGFDINCGLQTLATPFTEAEVLPKKKELADALYKTIPAGLGSSGKIKLSLDQVDEVLEKGARFALENGYGLKEDLHFLEESGRMQNADASLVSVDAKERLKSQLGTLGSGNHYLEVQVVERVFDEKSARALGLFEGQILVSIHCGSRGLGHQVGADSLEALDKATKKYNLFVPDRELVCAPIQSEEGQNYLKAVNAATNCAFANREVLAHLTRGAFERVMGIKEKEVCTLYGVGHNTAKVEKHKVDSKTRKLLVQRKGSTRGFGPGSRDVPEKYARVGQPVIVGGTMGTHSYVLTGTEKAMKETFGSALHGAGRTLSRVKALRTWNGESVVQDLARKGILVRGHGLKGIAEEAPGAYKDIDEVVDVVARAGLCKKVVRVKPWIVVKG
ncbi:MAG: RtcB family protein [Candidatus Diapherotrites archaeon]|nr:RtcB family protein [Candidatus Diapherotrites archaeon]